MTTKKKPGAPKGSQNRMTGDRPRVSITIRLPADLVETLRSAGNVTAQIEAAIKDYLKNP